MRLIAAAALATSLAFCQSPETRRLRADLDFLTSGALEGRVSLGRAADVTARYIAADFERTGLEGPFLQDFPLIAFRPDPQGRSVTIGAKTYRGVTVSFSRDVHITAPVVFAGYGITASEFGYDDYAGIDAKGKIVLMFDHEPQEQNAASVFHGTGHTLHAGRSRKLANARQHGALAIMIASEPLRKHSGLVSAPSNQGQALRASAPPQALDDDTQIPAFLISDEILEALLERPADVQRAIDSDLKPRSRDLAGTVELRSRNLETSRGTSLNAAGLLAGSDRVLKSETILIVAHHDHLGFQNGRLYAGANDNASGTVAVMELARMFAAGPRPKRSILFVVFGSEEQVMLGSYYYTSHPLRPLSTTRAVLNLDMIARDEAHIPQSQGNFDLPADTRNLINLVGMNYSSDLHKAIQRANEGTGLTLDTKHDREHRLNTLFRCDHLPFLLAGIPSVWIFGGFHPGYHEPSDTVDKLNFPKLEKVIRLTYRVAADLANTAKPPAFQLK